MVEVKVVHMVVVMVAHKAVVVELNKP